MENIKKCGHDMEIFSRVVGYFRPVQNWNEGKQAEFAMRKTFKIEKTVELCNDQSEEKSLFSI